MSAVKSNNNLNKNRSTIYKHKEKFFKNLDLQVVELEVVSEEIQAKLNKQIKKEKRVRLIADTIMITSILAAMTGVLIWLL